MMKFAHTIRTALAPSTDTPPLTLERAVSALIRGAGAGAVIVTLGIVAIAVSSAGLEGLPSALMISLVALPVAWVVWLIGLVVFGGPGWFLLHRLRWRSLPVALVYGAGMGFLTGFLLTLVSHQGGLFQAGFLGAAGIGAGGVIWMRAYGET